MNDLLRYAALPAAAWLHCVGTWLCEMADTLETFGQDDEYPCGPDCYCQEF